MDDSISGHRGLTGSSSFFVQGTSFKNIVPGEGTAIIDASSIQFEATVTNSKRKIKRVTFQILDQFGNTLGFYPARQNGNQYSVSLDGLDAGDYSWIIYARIRKKSIRTPQIGFTVQGKNIECLFSQYKSSKL